MKHAPTLADALIRESYGKNYDKIDPERKVAKYIAQANRFVLDDTMSAFMSDLAWASMLTCQTGDKANMLMEGLRKLARAPHRVTWIEYNMREKKKRADAEYSSIKRDVGAQLIYEEGKKYERVPEKGGWLIIQHPQVETAFFALECVSHTWDVDGTTMLPIAQANVVAHTWNTEDKPIPWNNEKFDIRCKDGTPGWISQMTIGVNTYKSPYVGVTTGFYTEKIMRVYRAQSQFNPLEELAGDLRHLWALLATINDLPVSISDVTTSKGFIAKGRHRKFVDHKVIRMTVPTKRYKKIAAQAIAHARRRAHQVRGHWRKDRWHPGERIWIREHQRGDASLGFVTHSYEITHPEVKP
jgi:hypothetical protein